MYACYSQQKSEKRREGKRKTADADVYIYPKRLVVLSAARRVVSRLVRVAVGSDWLARVNKNKHNQNDTRQIHPHRAWNTKTTRKRHENDTKLSTLRELRVAFTLGISVLAEWKHLCLRFSLAHRSFLTLDAMDVVAFLSLSNGITNEGNCLCLFSPGL